MSDTPRTDALKITTVQSQYLGYHYMMSLAENLERELAVANDYRNRWKAIAEGLASALTSAVSEMGVLGATSTLTAHREILSEFDQMKGKQ